MDDKKETNFAAAVSAVARFIEAADSDSPQEEEKAEED